MNLILLHLRILVAGLILAVFSGCASMHSVGSSSAVYGDAPASKRKLTESANLELEAKNPIQQAASARKLVEAEGGFVNHSNADEKQATLSLGVPTSKLVPTLDILAGLGRETSRSVHAEDVTGQHQDGSRELADLQAKRQRLIDLLAKVDHRTERGVAIEQELRGVDRDLESLRSRLANLNANEAYATIGLVIEKPEIPGPITLAFKSVGWVVKQLFVIG